MSDGFKMEYSGVNHLAADLGHVPQNLGPLLYKAFQVTAGKMKESARKHAIEKDRKFAKRYPYSIDYEITTNAGETAPTALGGAANEITALIGPNLGKPQGALGFLESSPGGARNAPQNNLRQAVAENADDFEVGILKAGADAIAGKK
jgi:hypothetical protein